MTRSSPQTSRQQPTPLPAGLTLTFLNSVGTGVATAGVYFITRNAYGFGPAANFALALVFGACYIPAALFIGPAIRRLAAMADWLSTRSALAAIMFLLSLTCLIPVLGSQRTSSTWPIWMFMAIYAPLTGAMWPIIESYISGGRSGKQLRSAIGRFNITWSIALVASFWFMAPIVEEYPLRVLAALSALHFAAIFVLFAVKPEPARHLPEHAVAPTPKSRDLLAVFRMQLPASFLVISILEPYLPRALERLDLPEFWHTPIAATWMASRVAAFITMERWHGWHGRFRTALISMTLMVVGFAMSVLGPAMIEGTVGLAVLLVGLGLLGLGIGAVYAAALYYAMEVGAASVDAGGTHEAIIGLGYTLGPICGLAAIGLIAGMNLPEQALEPAIVILVSIVVLTLAGRSFLGVWSAAGGQERGNSDGQDP